MTKLIHDALSVMNSVGRTFSAEHLPELKADIEAAHESGGMNDTLYHDLMGYFNFAAPEGVRTVIAVATPVPIVTVTFHWNGEVIATKVPPTYREYSTVKNAIAQLLNDALAAHGYEAKRANALPEKLSAARSGLAEYGRNNICYVDGMGSFALLSAYYTDVPCECDDWQPVHRMAECDNCEICIASCPTKAISADRPVIDVGRCITKHNESDAESFPEFIKPEFHNCIVGCLHCQWNCPANRGQRGRVEHGADFSAGETDIILKNKTGEELPSELKEKLASIGLGYYGKALARNLMALVASQRE